MITVKSKDGKTTRCELSEFDYSGQFMGSRALTATYDSPRIIDFSVDDYVEYRGEKYVIDYDPSISRFAQTLQSGKAISYQLAFKPLSVELESCGFQDYVLYDNLLHYSPSPKFSFVGTAADMADRIQANMDRVYPGLWKIEVSPSIPLEDKSIDVDNISCWNALVRLNKEYGLNFSVIGRKVRIGFEANALNHTFFYGKGNGLYQIDKTVNSDNAIITRLYAYGSDRNIPEGYNKGPHDIVPKKNLMLPGYLETGVNYIDSDNIAKYGVREYSVSFDDIYPSIEGVEVQGLGRLDEIVSAEKVTEETKDFATFTVEIKDIGFDINDYLTGQNAVVSIKSGSLIGYEFEIAKVEKISNGGYKLTLNKSNRDNWVVPNKDQNLSAGDRFVLLYIELPEKYVKYAEDKLLTKAKEYLSHYDHATYTYNVGVDEIFMARNFNLYQSIREGDKLRLYDADLNIDYEIIIQNLTIKEGGMVPVYNISLSDEPVAGTIDKIWDAISNIKDSGVITGQGSGTNGGISIEELNRKYLRKDVDDTDLGNLFLGKNIGSSVFLDDYDGKGWEIKNNGSAWFDTVQTRKNIFVGNKFGSPSFSPGFAGWGHEIDTPTATGTFDNIFIRKNFTAYTITYSQIFGLGGSQIVSDINKIASVEEMSDRYRCFMDSMDGLMLMNLRIGDGARIQTRIGTTSIKYLFGRVINVSADYFDIAKPLLEGEGAPEAGDFVLRWGNNQDKSRQGLIYLTTADQGAPFVAVYDGITGTSTKDALKVLFGNLSEVRTTQGVQLSGYGGYLNGIYIENSSIILDGGKTIEQQFSAMNGELNSKIEGVRNDMSLEKGNILRNSSFSENTNYWRSANSVHFINISKNFLWLDGSFYVEKDAVADIYRDGNRNVLRILNTSLRQSNDVMDGDKPKGTYSISLYAKVLRPGTLTVGFSGSELLLQQQLGVSENYQKISKSGTWDGQGDFSISFTGEVLIYGVSLFNDELADAVIKLQTKIFQNEEMIKLSATKDYVDQQTNQIYIHYDSEFTVTAEQISGISTKVDNINNTIETAGWITEAQGNTLFATKQLEDGNKLISYINQTATTTTISSDRINLYGAVTFQMFDPALTNKINNKADIGDVTAALRNYVTSSDLEHELKGYALAESLNGLVSSTYLTNALKSYATQSYANSQAQTQAKNAFDTLTDAMVNGNTTVIGGLISAEVLDVKSIYTNQAFIGNFVIEKGWFKSNAPAGVDVGYIDMKSGNNRIAFGYDLIPGSAGGSVTCSAIITNNNIASTIGGSAYALDLKAVGNAAEDKHAIALNCNGGVRIKGEFSLIEDLHNRININISNSSCSVANNLMSQRTFIYQVESYSNVYLPSDAAISSTFGYFTSGNAVADRSVITIRILVSRWSTAGINVQCSIPIVDNNGNPIKENSSVSYYNFNMEKGDYAELMYYNRNWYVINNNK